MNCDIQSSAIKQALQLLIKADLCHRVQCCSANGIPLAAEMKENVFKIFFLDVGLLSAMLALKLTSLKEVQDISFINQGTISEQVVGQLLRTIESFYVEPTLFYWAREQKGSAAEIDYIIQNNNQAIPIRLR